jgi:hypothetical protein
MKITNDILTELEHIRSAIDDMYETLEGVEFYIKHNATKVSYQKINPFDRLGDNFEYIAEKLTNIRDNSEVIGEE